MASQGNKIRAATRENVARNEFVTSSMQTCRLKDNKAAIENKLSRVAHESKFSHHLCGLRAVLDCLLANIPVSDSLERTVSYLPLLEAFSLYLSFASNGSVFVNDKDYKKRFRELVLHPEFGLCAYIIKFRGKEFIVLRPDNFDLEDFFFEILNFAEKDLSSSHFATNKEIGALYSILDTEWDRKVFRVFLGGSRSRSEFDNLGFDSDNMCKDKTEVFGFIEKMEEIETEAKTIVEENIKKNLEKKESLVASKIAIVASKQDVWEVKQLEGMKDEIASLEDEVASLQELIDQQNSKRKERMIHRCKTNLIQDRRLKMRKLGSGRKQSMDAIDEKFLVDCIMSKATSHGRRHDSVLYLNHRVKKKDFLNIVNVSRERRNLKPIRSATTAYNRSRPKNIRSLQAKKHKGLGLFCCKKPPKAEENNGLLTHFCRAQKKNVIRSLSKGNENSKKTLYRSFDDKAYICPGTGTGMSSSKSQKVFRPSDDEMARKLPRYDFPVSMVNCTPGTFLFMEKFIEDVDGKETFRTDWQQAVVVVKPKYFVGSSGTVWASHLMDIKHKEPQMYESEHPLAWQSKLFRSIASCTKDTVRYFFYQIDEDDLVLITQDQNCKFQEYELCKANTFKCRIEEIISQISSFLENCNEMEETFMQTLSNILSKLVNSLELYKSSIVDGDVSCVDLKNYISTCLECISGMNLPKSKARVVDLTDAGPGVGITNKEVKFRTMEEIRVVSQDYYIRHHLAPGDSSHNEVERIQSYVGMCILRIFPSLVDLEGVPKTCSPFVSMKELYIKPSQFLHSCIGQALT